MANSLPKKLSIGKTLHLLVQESEKIEEMKTKLKKFDNTAAKNPKSDEKNSQTESEKRRKMFKSVEEIKEEILENNREPESEKALSTTTKMVKLSSKLNRIFNHKTMKSLLELKAFILGVGTKVTNIQFKDIPREKFHSFVTNGADNHIDRNLFHFMGLNQRVSKKQFNEDHIKRMKSWKRMTNYLDQDERFFFAKNFGEDRIAKPLKAVIDPSSPKFREMAMLMNYDYIN